MNYTYDSPYHRITVNDVGYLRILRFERNRQSSMYLDAPFETDFEYPGYLHLTIAVKPTAERTCVIGLGGGTVVKRMWRDYPSMRLDVVELDEAVVDVCRRFFELPDDERIRVVVDEGRAFLERSAETYDILVVDAFDDDHVPRPLQTEEFMRTARERLAEDGVIAYNTIGCTVGPYSKPFRSLYRTLRNVWRNVWVFQVDDGVLAEGNNLILLATDAPLTVDELRQRIASRVGGLVTVPAFETFADALFEGPIRSGDVPLLTDPPSFRRKP